jgi:SNF2 family DNA or RNA helicase
MSSIPLLPYQRAGAEFLRGNPRSYLADDPGLGKTRQVLAAVDGPLTVVTTAAIRDADVWGGEAARLGWDHPLEVVSYHGMGRRMLRGPLLEGALVFDESQRLKNRKVSWYRSAVAASRASRRVHLLSGTPVPNQGSELWAQLNLIRDDMPAYWPWVRKWFRIEPTVWSAYNVTNRLAACGPGCGADCEHWAEFRAANLEGRWLRRERDTVLTDLPPLTGETSPLEAPMTTEQARVYRDFRKSFLADLPDGARLEAITHSEGFVRLCQLSTGLSSVDPALDPSHRQSGKMRLVSELLEDRSGPTFLVCWYRNTAEALRWVSEGLGRSTGMVRGATPQKDRKAVFRAFQEGSLDVLIGSVGVVAEGITLTAADEVVMVERSWVPSTNEQVIRRLHRIGQTRPVTVRQLVAPKTVDALQWAALRDKKSGIDPVLRVGDI